MNKTFKKSGKLEKNCGDFKEISKSSGKVRLETPKLTDQKTKSSVNKSRLMGNLKIKFRKFMQNPEIFNEVSIVFRITSFIFRGFM